MERRIIELTDNDMSEVKRLSSRKTLTHGDIVAYNQRQASRNGRVTKSQQYKNYMDAVDWMLTSQEGSVKRERDAANKAILGMQSKDIAPGAVHQNATLSNMSVQYANEAYIGETLMPVLQVSKETDVYYRYGQSDRLQYPDDEMGSRGQANEIQETRATTTYTCQPYGYSNFVSQRTLNNQDAPLDEMVDLVEAINEGLSFRRERRIANVLTSGANYGGNTTAIAAANRWDTATGGDPIADIQSAMAQIWMGRGSSNLWMFSSLNVYNVLSRHPAILDLFKYSGSTPGLATPDMLARFFGADGFVIGKAREDDSNENAALPNYQRVWGDVWGCVRVAQRASIRNAVFGYTFRNLQPETAVVFDPLKGHGGGYTAQVSVSETHDVVASPTGFLITTPIS